MDKYDGRVCMSSKSMSRIEAMFQAELERLGLNRTTASTLERRLTDLDGVQSLSYRCNFKFKYLLCTEILWVNPIHLNHRSSEENPHFRSVLIVFIKFLRITFGKGLYFTDQCLHQRKWRFSV